MAAPTDPKSQIAYSIEAYAERAYSYDDIHTEIFNPHEQRRLRETLDRAIGDIQSGGRTALDYGCGTGNLTRHLMELGMEVTAADLSRHFLTLVEDRYGVPTIHLIDGNVDQVPDDSFDFIGLYSVLHHIPAYLGVTRKLVTKLKRGGILMLDHERNAEGWRGSEQLAAFHRELADHAYPGRWAPHRHRWQHIIRGIFSPSGHRRRVRRWRDPRWSAEGDIHIWPDDHIDFEELERVGAQSNAPAVRRDNYLQHNGEYPDIIWERYRTLCTDTGCLILRRSQSQR